MIPAVTSGLYYGAGCFETFIAENGSIFKFTEHLDRLNKGLKYLGVSEPELIKAESTLDQLDTLLTKNNLAKKRSRIRIQVSLAEKNGYSYKEDLSTIVIISATSVKKRSKSKKLILSETSVVSSSARPTDLKLSNMLHYRQAYREAEQKGVDDAIMLTEDGFVSESSIANIFWEKNGTIFTPSEDCDILPGIMRNSILDILKNRMNHEVEEGRFSMNELMKADLIWLTNSVFEFVPVSKIGKKTFGVEKHLFSDLRNELNVYKKEYKTDV